VVLAGCRSTEAGEVIDGGCTTSCLTAMTFGGAPCIADEPGATAYAALIMCAQSVQSDGPADAGPTCGALVDQGPIDPACTAAIEALPTPCTGAIQACTTN
jgi:hypothetical protein